VTARGRPSPTSRRASAEPPRAVEPGGEEATASFGDLVSVGLLLVAVPYFVRI
jgi:hypothetical protein